VSYKRKKRRVRKIPSISVLEKVQMEGEMERWRDGEMERWRRRWRNSLQASQSEV